MWKRRTALNKVQSYETSLNKAIFAYLIIFLIYYLYTIVMQMLEITPERNDR